MFWDAFIVHSRYFSSLFMCHHTSEQIYEKLETVFNLGSCWLHILYDDFRD